MPSQIVRRKVSELKHGPNIRSDLGIEADLIRHGNSVKKKQRTPLLIYADGTVVDGNRTLAAARLVGIDELDCIVIEPTSSLAQYKRLQWLSNVHRADLSAFDKAVAIRDIKADSPEMTNRQLAEDVLDIKPPQMTKYLSLFDCNEDVQAAARYGKIGLSDWYEISKSPDQAKALERALKGAARAALEQERRENGYGKHKGNGQSATRPSTKSIPVTIASGLSVTFKAKGLTPAIALRALSEIRKQLELMLPTNHTDPQPEVYS